TQRGVPVLREQGYLDSEEVEEPEIATMAGGCFDMLVEDIDKGSCHIRLFLEAEKPRDRRNPAVFREMIRMQLPDDYFPRTFVVFDACVTNADRIWLFKYVWL